MDVDVFCSKQGSEEYLQIQNYILQNGSDFETNDILTAEEYLSKININKASVTSNKKDSNMVFDGLYVIKTNDIYQFIQP
jgi:hypothetical protein